jgi:hypothetical protein
VWSCKNLRFEGTYRLHHKGEKLSNLVFLRNVCQLLVIANIRSPLNLVKLMIEAVHSPKRLLVQESHGATYQKTVLFYFAKFTSLFEFTSEKRYMYAELLAVPCLIINCLSGFQVLTAVIMGSNGSWNM